MKLWVRSKFVDCLRHTSNGTIEKFTTGGEIRYPMVNPKLPWERNCTKNLMDIFRPACSYEGSQVPYILRCRIWVDDRLMTVCGCLQIIWGFWTSDYLQCPESWQGLGIGWPLLLGSRSFLWCFGIMVVMGSLLFKIDLGGCWKDFLNYYLIVNFRLLVETLNLYNVDLAFWGHGQILSKDYVAWLFFSFFFAFSSDWPFAPR